MYFYLEDIDICTYVCLYVCVHVIHIYIYIYSTYYMLCAYIHIYICARNARMLLVHVVLHRIMLYYIISEYRVLHYI